MQDAWLSELRRITRPDGVLLLTVEGQSTWSRIRRSAEEPFASRWQQELERKGILFIENDAWVGSTHPSFYHSTIHAPWYVFDHWAEFFDVDAYLVEGAWAQDLVVLRRRPDGASPSRPRIAPRPELVSRPQYEVDRLPKLALRAAGSLRARLRSHEPDIAKSDVDNLTREVAMLRTGLNGKGAGYPYSPSSCETRSRHSVGTGET